jgi:DNA-binding transcriptional LysR family regulator
MELHQVRYFVALCDTLNFTRAADACNVTQPALTRAIQRLEDELGGPLFQRERSLTQLTELGRLMRPLLAQTLAAAKAAKDHASRFRKSEVASLRLGLSPTVSSRVVVGCLAEVARRIPMVEIGMKSAPREALIEALLQGDLDAALLTDAGELPDRLNTWLLYKEAYRVAFAREHRFAALDAIPPEALDSEIVLERRGCDATGKLRALCAAAGATPRLRHMGENDDHLQHLAAASLGVVLIPAHSPVLPPLLSRPLAGDGLQRSVTLAVVNGRRFSPALDAFVRLSRACNFLADLAA